MKNSRALPYIILTFFLSQSLEGQEVVTGLSVNREVQDKISVTRTTKSATPDTLELPFFDDFSNRGPFTDQGKWIDNFAFINNAYPVNQITQGVATLDALDNTGVLYETATSNQFAADMLTSRPINLSGDSSDDFYLSFFYQPQGIADAPESTDSLTLLFFSPETEEWYHVWSAEGTELHPFKPVIIGIDDPKFTQKGFAFRFINYASLSTAVNDPAMAGNSDQWHIDYVLLDRGRNDADTLAADVAFTLPMRAPLKNYESMPWTHFRESYLSEQGNVVKLNYRNNDSIIRNVTRWFTVYDLYEEVNVYSSVPGATNVNPLQDIFYEAPLIYTFNTSNPDSALFLVKGMLITDDFDPKINDTISYLMSFKNYFAVDDGTSESGYGINGQGALNSMAVYRFRSFMKDSVRAVSICFNDSYNSANQRSFDLVLLQDNNGVPGDIIYAEEDFMVDPGSSVNGFITYHLSEAVEVDGYFFAGWRQNSETFLNAGLDLNTPHLNRQYYYINGTWNVSQVNGSLMIRPVMGKPLVASVNSTNTIEIDRIKLWPNPARELVNIGISERELLPGSEIRIFDSTGRQWIRCEATTSLDISSLPQGIYLLEIITHGRRKAVARFLRVD